MTALQGKTVVIVGGSLTGLFHGLYLKRHGVDVTILEKDPSTIRSSHQAGIAFGPAVEEFLKKYDDTNLPNCIPAVATRLDFRKFLNVIHLKVQRHETSWTLLYNILRANFDGLVSQTVPDPPPPRPGDGNAQYLVGTKVTEMFVEERSQKESIKLGYIAGGLDGNSTTRGNERVKYITADLVIAADGLHSTIRRLLDPPGVPSEYSGYVSWRGTVPENEVSPETLEHFNSMTALGFINGSYFVVYCIPPDSGHFVGSGNDQPDSKGSVHNINPRLINWVWYYNIPDNTQEMTEVLTNKEGYVHSNTVPSGLVRPEVWSKYLTAVLPHVAEPCAELLSKTKYPFVTKVNDALSEKATFYDGRVILTGDALATFRPHIAVATEKAAKGVLELGKVWEGEKTLKDWEKGVLFYEKKVWLASRVLGTWGCRGWWEFFQELAAFIGFMLKHKLAGWIQS
ncbi:6-hydroxynicotinate 3-monooxygenase [Naviculisporaceae sp. PSN 640]